MEDKVPDQVSETTTSRKVKVQMPGKRGKVGRSLVLRIPQGMLPELKRQYFAAFWDAETLDDPAATASNYQFFSQISQGSNSYNRLGDSIFVDRVVIRMIIVQSGDVSHETANLALVLDQEPAAGTPAWGDMFQGIGAASLQAYNVAIPNYDKRSRFKFIERASLPLAYTSAYGVGAAFSSVMPRTITFDIPIKRHVRYDGTGARPYSGAELMIWGWSDVASNTPQATASVEIFFTDD